MGANSIDISQYRSRIGTFAVKKMSFNTRQVSMGCQVKINNVMESLMVLSYLLVLSNITQILLMISGVELNPGPYHLGRKTMIIYIFLEKLQVTFSPKLIIFSPKIFTDKIPTTKNDQANRQISKVVDRVVVEKHQGVVSGLTFTPNSLSAASKIQQSSIFATDKTHIDGSALMRQIQNGDKSHTTKEVFDDIKLVHQKEKKKKEQNDLKQYQAGPDSEKRVNKNL